MRGSLGHSLLTRSYWVVFIVLLGACEGPQGIPGVDGNANVVSKTFTSNWILEDNFWYTVFDYPAINQDILDRGAVLVYLKVESSHLQLPVTLYLNENYSSTLSVYHSLGMVTIYWDDSDLLTPIEPGNYNFKVVVIAASTLAQYPGLNLSSYSEVASVLNLMD